MLELDKVLHTLLDVLFVLGWFTGTLFGMHCITYSFHTRGLILGLVKVPPHEYSSTFPPTMAHPVLFELWRSRSLDEEVWGVLVSMEAEDRIKGRSRRMQTIGTKLRF